jgi:hypothetical protein
MRFIYSLFVLLLIFACDKSKDEAVFKSAIETSQKLVEENEQQCTNSLKRIQKIVGDHGNRPEHLVMLSKALVLDSGIQKIVKLIDSQENRIRKEIPKENKNLLYTTKIDSDFLVNFFDVGVAHLNHSYNFKNLYSSIKEFQFIKVDSVSGALTIKSPAADKYCTASILLYLHSLKIELYTLGRLSFVEIGGTIHLTEPLFNRFSLFCRLKKDYAQEGDTVEGELSLVKYSDDSRLEMYVEGKKIKVINGIGKVEFLAYSEKFDKNGEARKEWKGKICLSIRGKDTCFAVRGEYIIKRKQL